jgi:hypothetical protein
MTVYLKGSMTSESCEGAEPGKARGSRKPAAGGSEARRGPEHGLRLHATGRGSRDPRHRCPTTLGRSPCAADGCPVPHTTARFTRACGHPPDAGRDAADDATHTFGLQAIAEHDLRTPIDARLLHADEAAAYAEEDRILADDAQASPTVHAVTVADLADEFTRLELTEAAASCR